MRVSTESDLRGSKSTKAEADAMHSPQILLICILGSQEGLPRLAS